MSAALQNVERRVSGAQDQEPLRAAQIEHLTMAVPPDGRPVLAWHEALAGEIHVARCGNPICSGKLESRVLAGVTRAGAGLSIAIGSDGNPVLSYRNDATSTLQVTVCVSPDCSLASHATIADDGVPGRHTSIIVPEDGRPLISFHDSSTSRIKLARCADAHCSAASVVMINWHLAGPHCSAEIAPDGLPALAFQDQNGALLFARCASADCSDQPAIHSVDGSAAGAGRQPTLRFGPDGLPIMSYLASAPGRITVAKCSDADCADVVITEIDQMGPNEIGVDSPALAIAPSGLPLIAYRRTDATLRIAECRDPGCAEGSRKTLTGVQAGEPGTALVIGADGSALLAYVDSSSGTAQARVTRPTAGSRNEAGRSLPVTR